MEDSLRRVSRYFILFMVVSFLGWATETLFFLLCYGRLYDRGFMTLPFCTIYGCAFLLVDRLLGMPEKAAVCPGEGGRLLRSFEYFFLCALIPTGLELVTGYVFHQLFDLRLWDYSAYRFHFKGYICPAYSLLWGLLIPLCMQYAFRPLKKWVFTFPGRYMGALSAFLALFTVLDLAYNFSHQALPAFARLWLPGSG